MNPRSIRLAVSAFLALGVSSTSIRAQSFTGLGEIAGGGFFSEALGVSAAGSTVVGDSLAQGSPPCGGRYAAFVWRAASGMLSINDQTGSGASSYAYAASADGLVVGGVDFGGPPMGARAFYWTDTVGPIEFG